MPSEEPDLIRKKRFFHMGRQKIQGGKRTSGVYPDETERRYIPEGCSVNDKWSVP